MNAKIESEVPATSWTMYVEGKQTACKQNMIIKEVNLFRYVSYYCVRYSDFLGTDEATRHFTINSSLIESLKRVKEDELYADPFFTEFKETLKELEKENNLGVQTEKYIIALPESIYNFINDFTDIDEKDDFDRKVSVLSTLYFFYAELAFYKLLGEEGVEVPDWYKEYAV